MNGFANVTLTLLLSWLKSMITNLWQMLNSENGGALYHWIAGNWKAIVLVLCVGGVVADWLIYLFRWRPYYVWRTSLRHLFHGRWGRPKPSKPKENLQPETEHAAYVPPQPEQDFAAYSPPPPAAQTQAYSPVNTQTHTAVYAPARAQSQPTAAYTPVSQEAVSSEPLFDEEGSDWAHADELVRPAGRQEGAASGSFGMPRPEPLAYIRDMQAGFARPLPPEQLYAPQSRPDSAIHPGLNAEALQRFGLGAEQEAPDWEAQPPQEPVVPAPAFQPFTARREQPEARQINPFSRLARKARGLVGVNDEGSRPTIRDLHSTVDVASAFHEPVYPQPREQQGGEE